MTDESTISSTVLEVLTPNVPEALATLASLVEEAGATLDGASIQLTEDKSKLRIYLVVSSDGGFERLADRLLAADEVLTATVNHAALEPVLRRLSRRS